MLKRHWLIASVVVIAIAVFQLDLAKANADTADAEVAAAKATITQAIAQVQQKQAAVTVAQTNLDYTTIHAPIDGTVIARSVDVGQTVAASLQAPTLFTIAQDLTKMQVYASTDESDVRDDPHRSDCDVQGRRISERLFYRAGVAGALECHHGAECRHLQHHHRFRSADQIRALYKQYGLISGEQTGTQAAATQGSGDTGAAGKQRRAHAEGTQGGGEGSNTTQQTRTPRVDVAVVWKLRPDKTLEPVRIRTGITDHTVTEVAQVLKASSTTAMS